MSDIYDRRSQGLAAVPKRPASRSTPAPVSAGQVRGEVQRAINRENAELTRPRPPQRVTGRQDWRRG
jgi:hypothetical protein